SFVGHWDLGLAASAGFRLPPNDDLETNHRMTTLDYIPALGDDRREHYLNISYRVKSWLLTVDHKRIGILYLISITAFFMVGGFFATMMRLELATPRGDLMTAETYNKVFTMHGIFMIFLFLIPSIPA